MMRDCIYVSLYTHTSPSPLYYLTGEFQNDDYKYCHCQFRFLPSKLSYVNKGSEISRASVTGTEFAMATNRTHTVQKQM